MCVRSYINVMQQAGGKFFILGGFLADFQGQISHPDTKGPKMGKMCLDTKGPKSGKFDLASEGIIRGPIRVQTGKTALIAWKLKFKAPYSHSSHGYNRAL